MSGSRAGSRYDIHEQSLMLARIDTLERSAYLRGRDLEINLAPVANAGGRVPRLILRSPNGTRYSVVVDNAGVLSTEVLP